jgi:hypothetical protein
MIDKCGFGVNVPAQQASKRVNDRHRRTAHQKGVWSRNGPAKACVVFSRIRKKKCILL